MIVASIASKAYVAYAEKIVSAINAIFQINLLGSGRSLFFAFLKKKLIIINPMPKGRIVKNMTNGVMYAIDWWPLHLVSGHMLYA